MSDSAKAKNLEFSSDSKFGEGKKNVKKKVRKNAKKKMYMNTPGIFKGEKNKAFL